MAARSIASLTLGFGLVAIPVKLYPATESAAGVSFNLLHICGSRLRQQYVCQREQVPVPREEIVKGYEFEKDRYVMFTPQELKALEEASRPSIDIFCFIPLEAVDPIYYDRAYYLAPDKRGGKPYQLLLQAMQHSGRCALARWVWKGRQYIVQVRSADDGLVLQQLLYADEVRAIGELGIEAAAVQPGELALALQLIEQNAVDRYDPAYYQDEEKQRVLAAIDRKIAGQEVVEPVEPPPAESQVIDLISALRASLAPQRPAAARMPPSPLRAAVARPRTVPAPRPAAAEVAAALRDRKSPRRASPAPATPQAAPARGRARK